MKRIFQSPMFSAPRAGTLALGIVLALGGASAAQAYQVQSGKIHDDAGQRIALRGVNWFGFETASHAPHGLWARNADDMIAQMKSLGVNAVRLPVAPATLHGASVTSVSLALNPQFAGMNGLQVLDYIVHALDQAGIYVLLDHHRPDDEAISALWYTASYSEKQWLDDLKLMAARYKGVPHVLGIDLKNEPHGPATWGVGNPSTDWNLAAERAAQAVLSVNDRLVVFVGGIEEQATCSGAHAHGWGGNLEPLRCMPLSIPQNKLVFAPHFYGPDIYMYSYFSDPAFPANMPAIWQANFGFARDMGHAVMPTEFGSRYGHGGLALDKVWFDAAIDWMVGKDLRDGFFWSWNPNSSDTGGLLKDDWTNVWTDKLARLQTLWGVAPSTPPVVPPPESPAASGDAFSISRVVDSDWGAGYCVSYSVLNVSDHAAQWATSFGFQDKLDRAWNAVVTVDGASIKAKGESWNSSLQPGQKASFGYCATRPAPSSAGATATQFQTQLTSLGDWGKGYCTGVRVTNTSKTVAAWSVTLPLEGRITSAWSANVTAVGGGKAKASGLKWNAYLNPGASTSFGFCASR